MKINGWKKKESLFMIVTFGIVFMLISSVFLFVLPAFDEEEKSEPTDTSPSFPITDVLTKTYDELKEEGLLEQMDIVDDRIAPYENQAVVLEILRVRHRGLLNRLLRPGLSWKQTPEFYFISTMDGMEYVSKDISQHMQSSEVLFTTWDSIFQENKVVRTAEQDQETSQITLTIVEREKKGLFGLRSQDIEKDSFTVTYCYRTGRWTGDDSFRDEDGYGYYLGDTFEIWFNLYQMDYDDDYIPYWMEVNVLNTDPTVDDASIDPDDDSIPLFWEWNWGYDPYTWDDHRNLDPDMDSITNDKEYQFAKYYADPYIENIYLEVDHMQATGITDPAHVFYEESKQALIERYAQHNIKAFFDDGWENTPMNGGGESLRHFEQLSQDSGMILQYYNNHFPDERKGTFIYCLLGHKGGYQHPAKGNVYDAISVWTTPFTILSAKELLIRYFGYGQSPTPRGTRVAVASSLLHELGHFGGLTSDYFEGVDKVGYKPGGATFDILQGKEFRETWGQYRSVMNYAYIYRHNVLDYSDGSNDAPYDQNDWENLFLGGWSRTSLRVEEAYYLMYGDEWEEIREKLIDKNISLIETPPISGYEFDQNLTSEFTALIGDYSPNPRWDVEWAVHRLVEKEKYPHFRDVKILVSPKDISSKYATYWSLFLEGDLDENGDMILSL
ncbi:MAG: hypothetical protein KGY67_05155 [Candidatus Thermoplasmatota archaeon]|nr:hypothetical protein [Candidatus Thermoplasmatota archaeon]